MAKAELSVLLDKLSGRINGKSRVYSSQRYGQTVVSTYPLHKNPKSISARQRELNTQFTQSVQQCKVDMADPERLAWWQSRYAEYTKLANKNLNRANAQFFGENSAAFVKQKYYQTLRGFIIAQLTNHQTSVE